MKILITGGAGFIGTHLTRHLLALQHEVTVLDAFVPQVHGSNGQLAPDLRGAVRLLRGDVGDAALLRQGLQDAEAVVHLAAETGTAQSMYEVALYGRTNLMGSATLYELLAKEPHRVERIVVASSRSIYGEGAYHCSDHGMVYPVSRSSADKQAGLFDPLCPACKAPCMPVPTPERCPLRPASFYGFTKQAQEEMTLLFGSVLGIPSVALRYQNVFGAGQSLDNPYTGILAIFSNLARVGRTLQVFEDGQESRDFVHVSDVVRATTQALLEPLTGSHAVNVGSGVSTSILEVAQEIKHFYDSPSSLMINGRFREGDIRHGVADLALAHTLLKYSPTVSFHDGLHDFLAWAGESVPSSEGFDRSLAELSRLGLLREQHANPWNGDAISDVAA